MSGATIAIGGEIAGTIVAIGAITAIGVIGGTGVATAGANAIGVTGGAMLTATEATSFAGPIGTMIIPNGSVTADKGGRRFAKPHLRLRAWGT